MHRAPGNAQKLTGSSGSCLSSYTCTLGALKPYNGGLVANAGVSAEIGDATNNVIAVNFLVQFMFSATPTGIGHAPTRPGAPSETNFVGDFGMGKNLQCTTTDPSGPTSKDIKATRYVGPTFQSSGLLDSVDMLIQNGVVSDTARVDLVLQLGNVNESVTVSAEAAQSQTAHVHRVAALEQNAEARLHFEIVGRPHHFPRAGHGREIRLSRLRD
jgi:hypothetical protein